MDAHRTPWDDAPETDHTKIAENIQQQIHTLQKGKYGA
jgi:hypothetical protein